VAPSSKGALHVFHVSGQRCSARGLQHHADGGKVLVLALPRGGVPVAYEVAGRLRAALEVFVVRKLGVPGHSELAMGAIASGGVRVLNQVAMLAIPGRVIDEVTAREREELARREAAYRGQRPYQRCRAEPSSSSTTASPPGPPCE
jgi:putative phosphoribosyl transferase